MVHKELEASGGDSFSNAERWLVNMTVQAFVNKKVWNAPTVDFYPGMSGRKLILSVA